jgi:hypothetical protein
MGGVVTTVAELLQPVESDLDTLLAELRTLIGAIADGKRVRVDIVDSAE